MNMLDLDRWPEVKKRSAALCFGQSNMQSKRCGETFRENARTVLKVDAVVARVSAAELGRSEHHTIHISRADGREAKGGGYLLGCYLRPSNKYGFCLFLVCKTL